MDYILNKFFKNASIYYDQYQGQKTMITAHMQGTGEFQWIRHNDGWILNAAPAGYVPAEGEPEITVASSGWFADTGTGIVYYDGVPWSEWLRTEEWHNANSIIHDLEPVFDLYDLPAGHDSWETVWQEYYDTYIDPPSPPAPGSPCGCPEMRVKKTEAKLLAGTADPCWCLTKYPSELGLGMEYDMSWEANESNLMEIMSSFGGPVGTDSIPESYYINGPKINMSDAPIKGSTLTALGHPRNKQWFWEQLLKQKPEMFDLENRNNILKLRKAPVVNAKWIEYNPTHSAYLGEVLHHHHINQGNYAAAIPKKVHTKWSGILHQYKNSGKLNSINTRLNGLVAFLNVFQTLVDVFTGNPNGLINQLRPYNEVGVLYYDASNDVYFEISKIIETKDTNGVVVKVTVNYTTYESYVYDSDESKNMGVLKLGSFIEEYNPITNTTITTIYNIFM